LGNAGVTAPLAAGTYYTAPQQQQQQHNQTSGVGGSGGQGNNNQHQQMYTQYLPSSMQINSQQLQQLQQGPSQSQGQQAFNPNYNYPAPVASLQQQTASGSQVPTQFVAGNNANYYTTTAPLQSQTHIQQQQQGYSMPHSGVKGGGGQSAQGVTNSMPVSYMGPSTAVNTNTNTNIYASSQPLTQAQLQSQSQMGNNLKHSAQSMGQSQQFVAAPQQQMAMAPFDYTQQQQFINYSQYPPTSVGGGGVGGGVNVSSSGVLSAGSGAGGTSHNHQQQQQPNVGGFGYSKGPNTLHPSQQNKQHK
jgi:hypothetical protein